MSTTYDHFYSRFLEEVSELHRHQRLAFSYIVGFVRALTASSGFPAENIQLFAFIPESEREVETRDFDLEKPLHLMLAESEMERDEEGDWVMIVTARLGNPEQFQPWMRAILRPKVRIQGNNISLWACQGSAEIMFDYDDETARREKTAQFYRELRGKIETSIALVNKAPKDAKRMIGFAAPQQQQQTP